MTDLFVKTKIFTLWAALGLGILQQPLPHPLSSHERMSESILNLSTLSTTD